MLVSLVIPTLNEASSIPSLLDRLECVAQKLHKEGIQLELIFVDDGSTDGTTDSIRRRMNPSSMAIQIITRHTRGLATAVLAGFSAAKGDIFGAIDSDGSHPPELIPTLLAKIPENDMVIASRNLPGGGVEDWPLLRQWCSKFAAKCAWPLYGKIRDPMSGYFFLKRSVIEGLSLNPLGYKILLEIIVKGNYKNYSEVPYLFRNRDLGKSKMDSKVMLHYALHLLKLYLWKIRKIVTV